MPRKTFNVDRAASPHFRYLVLFLAASYAAILTFQFHKRPIIPDSSVENLLNEFQLKSRRVTEEDWDSSKVGKRERKPTKASELPWMHSEQEEWFGQSAFELNDTENTTDTNASVWMRKSQSILPLWIRDYFEWHNVARSNLTAENWSESKYLIMRCLKSDMCGEVSDRLLPIPTMLKICAKYNRILFVYWESPTTLDSYLVPTMAGIDWRIPDFLLDSLIPNNSKIPNNGAAISYKADHLDKLEQIIAHAATNEPVIRTRYQSPTHGSEYFDDKSISPSSADDASFSKVFYSLWSALFEPAEPLGRKIMREIKELHLVPGRYIGAYLQAPASVSSQRLQSVEDVTRDYLNCASGLRQSDKEPFLFVSDAAAASAIAVDHGNRHDMRIVVPNSTETYLEKGVAGLQYFQKSFFDIYMLSLARCITGGRSGLGELASLLQKQGRCSMELSTSNQIPECDWIESAQPRSLEKSSSSFNFFRSSKKTRLAQASRDLASLMSLTKLQDILDEIYLKTGRPAARDIWEHSLIIPEWMKVYFRWHKEQRAIISEQNFMDHRYLVMQCIAGKDGFCGGTSDRLKPFLAMVRIAKEQNRLLFIHWTSPARLQEFLQPPKGGVDWRAPSWLAEMIESPNAGLPMRKMAFIDSPKGEAIQLLRTRYQSISGGMEQYDEKLESGEAPFNVVYHDVWRVFFTPSPPVALLIEKEMKKMNLVVGKYAAAHLRALYEQVNDREKDETRDLTRNSVNCASSLYPGRAVYFASDYSTALTMAVDYGKELGRKVFARDDNISPLHLEKASNMANRSSTEFYDTFVDLLLLGMSRCVTYNRGGYGHWGRLISYNSTCYVNQKTTKLYGPKIRCNWTEPVSKLPSAKKPETPLFLPPIDYPDDEIDAALVSEKTGYIYERPMNTTKKNLGQSIPKWMNEYFAWHTQQRKDLSPTNWESKKFLVMECHLQNQHCGGISDRLRPLPFVVLSAHRTKRILLIYWTKPARLENYYLPPQAGLDWRVPQWLEPHLIDDRIRPALTVEDAEKKLRKYADETVVRTAIQSSTSGADYYEEQPDAEGSTYYTAFHGLFRSLFVPSDRLSVKVRTIMDKFGLVPGQYAAAHLRAMYGNRRFRPPHDSIALVVNALNCASTLLPGCPVYFSSDITFGIYAAREYGRQRSLPMASLLDTFQVDSNGTFVDSTSVDPIHIDKDPMWMVRGKKNPAAYDDAFLDLYMLSQSRCVATSNGGFGVFGQMISHDPFCSIRHFQQRKILHYCSWRHANGTFHRYSKPEINIPARLLVDPGAKK